MSVQVGYGKQFVWLILSIIIILTVVESSVRIYEYVVPSCFYLTSDAGYKMDLELKKKICEQSEFIELLKFPVYQFAPNQDHDTISINSFGFRGADFEEKKDPNVFRIMMVGGSTTFGSGSTSNDATIPEVLQKKFLENNYDVEVINAGVGAATSIEEAYKIRHHYKKYQPDLFLVYDGRNDSFQHLEDKELHPNVSRIEKTQAQKSSLQIWISENLQMYRTIFVLYPIFSHYSISMTLNDDVYEKNSEIWSDRWENICKENNEDGIKTIVALQPTVGTSTKQLSPSEKIHSEYIKAVNTREQLEFFSKTLPIESCTASFDLRNALDGVEEPIYFDDCHMNDQGYEIMANKIYEKILPLIINDLETKK